jgi:hypothetical protein
MEVYLSENEAPSFMERAESMGIEARCIGYVEHAEAPEVMLTTASGNQVIYRK